MRVITGKARGKILSTLTGNDVRPTTDMVKEAIFSIIQFDISDACVLDLFSGSGQLGIEALSRGASFCTFTDSSNKSIKITNENIASVNFSDISEVFCIDSLSYVKGCNKKFDIMFLDPPYNKGILEAHLPHLERISSENAVVVCEHERGLLLDDEYGNLHKRKTYRYGSIEVTVFDYIN